MNFCHIKIDQDWSEDELLISVLLLDLLFLLFVKAVLGGADRKVQNSDGSAAPFPVCILLTWAGMAQAAPAFVTLLDAFSVAIYFLKTQQVFCFEN